MSITKEKYLHKLLRNDEISIGNEELQNKFILQSDYDSNLDSDIDDIPNIEKKDDFNSSNKDNEMPNLNIEDKG